MTTSPAYVRRKSAAGARNRAISLEGRDIGKLPTVKNRRRRAAAEKSLRLFCEYYFPGTFTLAWSPDHLRAIAKAEAAVLEGRLFAIAMPRGSGKTSIVECAALWATCCGHRGFVVPIGVAEAAAQDMLESMKTELESNDLLAEDFPEVCVPIRSLDGIANRCAGQLCRGVRTNITWTSTEVVLPTVKRSKASGAIIKVAGLEGRIRGMKFKRSDGRAVRPDLVIIDDCQTDQSARSLSQCETRERLLAGAVLGLAGPGKKIAGIMPCTVIRQGDVADNLLDPKKHPEWNGERTKLIYKFPTNQKLWTQYAEIRADSLRSRGDISLATKFYRKNRREMDEGATVAWPERFNPDEGSAVQYAMNLRIQDERAFMAEYQNDPLGETHDVDDGTLTADQIAEKLSGHERYRIPIDATRVTAFIDCGQRVLHCGVLGWSETFTGYVLDYGTYPDQDLEYFTSTNAAKTLQHAAPAAGREGQLHAGLTALVDRLFARTWTRDDGATMSIGLCLIDSGWLTDVVYAFIRQSPRMAQLMPSKGQFFGARSRPIREWAKKPGDVVGLGWKIPVGVKRQVRHVVFDSNHWKSFVHARLATGKGDPGCMTLFDAKPQRHRMFAEHLTSEKRKRDKGPTGLDIDEWAPMPGAENHFLDVVVGAAVAASVMGAALPGLPSSRPPARKKVSVAELRGRLKQA